MTEEEFKRTYMDTHAELQLTDALEKGSFNKGTVVRKNPSDKSVTSTKITGKNIIERQKIEERTENMAHMLLDAISVKSKEILDVPVERLIGLAIKASPTKLEAKHEVEFTFADMVRRANMEIETYETIENETE